MNLKGGGINNVFVYPQAEEATRQQPPVKVAKSTQDQVKNTPVKLYCM
jgi:hypothetical protein